MDSLQITSNERRIAINNDPERIIRFNPSDVVFAEKFYNLIGEFQKTLTQYEPRAREIESNTETDENGLPVNFADRIALHREICDYIRERIDHLFGIGTSQTAFGDDRDPDQFTQFFEGLKPFFKDARTAKVEKYTNSKKRVMK